MVHNKIPLVVHYKQFKMVLKTRVNIFMLLLLQNFKRNDSKNDSWSARFLFDSFFGLESLDDLDVDISAGPKLCKCGKFNSY